MTTGEGGMVVTGRDDVAERARQFVEHGRTDDGYAGLGHNFCMSDITAAIGRVQLERLPAANKARRENAERLTAVLRELPVDPPVEPAKRRHVYHIYTISTDERDAVRSHLRDRDIQSGVYYETPIHHQPAYADYEASLEVVESLADRVLALPVHDQLSADELERVCAAIQDHWDR